jgi:hypothetical protein
MIAASGPQTHAPAAAAHAPTTTGVHAASAGAAAMKAPPARLPAEHFGAALLFLLLGALGLIVIAPELAAGAFVSPRVAGVTHLFTLGWITTSIMGALYQFLPVALGEPIPSVRLAHATFGLYVPGLSAFVVGLVTSTHAVTLVGAASFGAGILLFAGNLAGALKAARRRDVTWWALAGADLYLVITLLFGLALTGNLRWGYLGAGRLSALGVHLHVALAGWVLMVMIGVAQRLLPMFLLSHGAGDRGARVAVACIGAGTGMLAILHHAPALVSHWIPALLIAAGVAAFLAQARAFYAHRHRPSLDPGMRLAAGGLGVLALALILAWPVLLGGGARSATAYVLTILLGISVFVAAHYYKIVPFLTWYHRFAPQAGRGSALRVSDLYSARAARVAGAALLTGVVMLIASVALGWPVSARAGAVVFAAGAALEAVQMVLLARKHA